MKYIVAFAFGLLSATANAKIVTYNFSGVFSAPERHMLEDGASTEPLLLGLIKEGDAFSGQFSYDTDALPVSGHAGSETYVLQNFRFKASGAFNDAAAAWSGQWFNANHGFSFPGLPTVDDSFSVSGETRVNAGSSPLLDITVGADLAQDTLNRPGLPDTLGTFSNSYARVFMYYDDPRMYDEVVSSVRIELAPASPVPEPSSAALMLAALAGMGGVGALRRRR